MASPDDKKLEPGQIELYTPALLRIRDLIKRESEAEWTEDMRYALEKVHSATYPPAQAKAIADASIDSRRDAVDEFKRAKVTLQDMYQLHTDMLILVDRSLNQARGSGLTIDESAIVTRQFFTNFLTAQQPDSDVPRFDERYMQINPEIGGDPSRFVASPELSNVLNFVTKDLENEVIRFPTAFTREKKIRIAGQQFQQAGIITPG